MSFWGATVITSLATTIPVVGKQIVYWLWGGLQKASYYGDVIIKTLLDAGNGFFLFKKVCIYTINLYTFYLYTKFQSSVKMVHMLTQSAGLSTTSVGNSQRLNAEDLMWLVGFVEGDGTFSVNQNGKYFKCEFCIELSIRDIQLLYKIKKMLAGHGSITTRKRGDFEFARYKISSKAVLIQVVCPIFDQYPMLTSKHYDYIHFRNCLFVNTSLYKDLPFYKRPNTLPMPDVDSILALPYFDNWLVGFIEAEGSFSTYLPSSEKYYSSAFSITQKEGLQIMSAIKKRLSLKSNPYLNVTHNGYSLNTTSTRGIQNVINFLNNTPAKLMGYKRAQYLKWLHDIRVNAKYTNVIVPFKY